VDLEAVLGGSWWILTWILVDLDDTWITYYARLKTQKTIKIIRFLLSFERSILVDLGGSWWILTWILVDLDVDLGGSWWILKRFLVDLGGS
jgi:hypothetical protein